MSVWYVGSNDSRTIEDADWDAVGVDDGGTFTWDASNGWSIPDDRFSVQQVAWLRSATEFLVGAPDGPRSTPVAELDGYVTRAQVLALLQSADATGLSKASVGLDQVDNTTDLGKPISTATQAALDEKADYPDAGADGQMLVKSGDSTAWAAPSGGGSVGVTPVTGDAYWSNGSLFNITGSGVAQAPDDPFWPTGTLYTVN